MARYGNRLVLYIDSYLHDIHDSEDLMIEAFAYLIAKKPHIHDGCFKAYLYKAARNLSLRFVAKKRMSRCISFDETNKDPESKILIDEVVQTEERNHLIHICMEQLKPDYREALYLVYFEDMCHSEAAIVMKKSEKQIADLIYRGRSSLHKILGKKGITNAQY